MITTMLPCRMPTQRLWAHIDDITSDPTLDAHVRHCEYCRQFLTDAQQLQTWASELRDDTLTTAADYSWAKQVMAKLPRPIRDGERIPVVASREPHDLAITESTLRQLLRSYCSTPQALILKTVVTDHADTGTVSIEVHTGIRFGEVIRDVTNDVRRRVCAVVAEQTGRRVSRVDIHVTDVFEEV